MFTVNKTNFVTSMLIIAILCLKANADTSTYIRNYEADTSNENGNLSNWTFVDFKVGPTSSNLYFLLKVTSNENDQSGRCAVIKENTSGSKVWAKSYVHNNTECGLLTIDRYEQFFYYTVEIESTKSLIMQMYCRTGEIVRQHELDLHSDSKIQSMTATSNYYYVYFISKFSNGTTWLGRFYAAGTTSSDAIAPRYYIPENITGTMTEVHARNHSYVLYTTIISNTKLGYVMLDWTQNNSTWSILYDCGSSCSFSNTTTDSTETLIHSAIGFSSGLNVMYRIYNMTNGNALISYQRRNSTCCLTLSSLYVDSNSIAWISMYSGSDYSEFVKYDQASNQFTIYQQQGVKYIRQYANSQNQWYGLKYEEPVVHYAQLSDMEKFSDLSVNVSSSGFIEDVTALNKLSTNGISNDSITYSSPGYTRSSTETYSLNYTRTDKRVGNNYMFSKRTMTNILAGFFIFLLISAIAKKVSKLIKKKCSRRHELVNETEVEHENLNVNDEDRNSNSISNSDENHSGSNEHSDDSNQKDESKNNDDNQDEEDQV